LIMIFISYAPINVIATKLPNGMARRWGVPGEPTKSYWEKSMNRAAESRGAAPSGVAGVGRITFVFQCNKGVQSWEYQAHPIVDEDSAV
jgi:hypothetical protein